MVVLVLRYYASGWVLDHHVAPEHVFPHAGFSWLPRGSAALVHLRFLVLAAAGAAFALGWRFRIAAAGVFVVFTWNHLLDRALYLNHYHLVSLLALLSAFAPLHRLWSLDARAGRVREASVAPALWLGVFRFQIAAVYVFAGLGKIGHDWLVEGQPLRSWLLERSDLPLIGAVLARADVAVAASWAAMLFDLAIPFLVLAPRTRRLGFAVLALFHLGTHLLFPIGLFPVLMLAAASLLLGPSWPRALLRRLGVARDVEHRTVEDARAAAATTSARTSGAQAASRAQLVAVCAWIVLQTALPLRSHLHGGDVLWHERGFRFSWRVMLVEKRGTLTYRIHDLDTDVWERADPSRWLTPLQERMAQTQPDLIVDVARLIAADARRAGRRVAVHALARCRLGDRPSRYLIDPRLDLAAPGLRMAAAILPLEDPQPRLPLALLP